MKRYLIKLLALIKKMIYSYSAFSYLVTINDEEQS